MTEMKKILICEDEADTQKSLKNILMRKDYEIYTAVDGKEAIDKTRQINPDLLLLDIRMPKIDGLEVTREIRKFNTLAKIIFITAFQSPELIKEAVKYDIVDYLLKPIPPETILQVIDQALAPNSRHS